MDDDHKDKPLTFGQILHSVLAAAFGVQSGKHRQRDFSRGKPSHFIAIGVLFTLAFAALLYGVVELVLYLAGAK